MKEYSCRIGSQVSIADISHRGNTIPFLNGDDTLLGDMEDDELNGHSGSDTLSGSWSDVRYRQCITNTITNRCQELRFVCRQLCGVDGSKNVPNGNSRYPDSVNR